LGELFVADAGHRSVRQILRWCSDDTEKEVADDKKKSSCPSGHSEAKSCCTKNATDAASGVSNAQRRK